MIISWNIQNNDRVTSTQELLKEKAQEGAAEGLVVQAEEQSAGHGRHGREWVSPKGNLYLSVLLKPNCEPTEVGQLSLVSGLALYDAIDGLVSGLELKWPNDVLLNGKKCAGLILETEITESIEWVALGVGINIASAPDIGTCLGENSITIDDLRDRFLNSLQTCYQEWLQGNFQKIKEKWIEKAHVAGTKLEIKLGNQVQQGYFHGLDDNGNLFLKNEAGQIQTITAGDVYLA